MKSGNLNFLEPSGPLQAYNGTALFLAFTFCHFGQNILSTLLPDTFNIFSAFNVKDEFLHP